MMLRQLKDGERGPAVRTDIDLEPAEWRAHQGRPGEPFFGEGALPWLVWVTTYGAMFTLINWLR